MGTRIVRARKRAGVGLAPHNKNGARLSRWTLPGEHSLACYLVDATRAARPLEAIKRFMSDNNAVIMMVVLLLLGAKLLGDGLAVL
jgi:hypothetical protein